jgi:transposase
MSRPLAIRQPTAAEIHQLHTRFEDSLNPWQRRRAEAIVLYATGMIAVEIAHALAVHPNTIYADLHAFAQYGGQAINQLGSPGAPVRLSEVQRAEIVRLAEVPPYELGLPYGRWSAAKLRSYLLKPGVVKAISREHLRRVLKKGAQLPAGPTQAPQPCPPPAGPLEPPALAVTASASQRRLALL